MIVPRLTGLDRVKHSIHDKGSRDDRNGGFFIKREKKNEYESHFFSIHLGI